MSDNVEELASISALMLDQFTTFNMTGWYPRCGSDEFNTLRLLRRNDRFLLRVVGNRREVVAEIVLNDVVSYVIKVPTWHEVKQADSSLIALHLSRSPDFTQFYDLLVSSLKVLQKYDRLADRIGVDEKTFLDELSVVRVRMEQMSVGVPLTTDPPPKNTPRQKPLPTLPPPPPPKRHPRSPSQPQEPVSLPQPHPQSQTDVPIPSIDKLSLESVRDDNEYYVVVPADNTRTRLSQWVCPRCTLINKSHKYECGACEKPRADAWRCIRCPNINRIDVSACTWCKELRCRRCDLQNEPGTPRCTACHSDLSCN